MPASPAEQGAPGGRQERAVPRGRDALSHNLLGQRLGRKGRDTRERILAAATALLDGPREVPLSMSAVARGASLGMTTLYLYFKDLAEILLALLDPILASGEAVYLAQLRTRWRDETLFEQALAFVEAYYGFWQRHERILHLRNGLAEQGDDRMMAHRVAAARPIMDQLMMQMDAQAAEPFTAAAGMASALMTGIERSATVSTHAGLHYRVAVNDARRVRVMIDAEARILGLAIADVRRRQRAD